MKPLWADAPEWAQWLAADRELGWHWYEHMPWAFLKQGQWFKGEKESRFERASEPCFNAAWQCTLEQRPEYALPDGRRAASIAGAAVSMDELLDAYGRYHNPARCNRGHKTLPMKLWDCPMCSEIRRAENRRLIEALRPLAAGDLNRMRSLGLPHVADQCGAARDLLRELGEWSEACPRLTVDMPDALCVMAADENNSRRCSQCGSADGEHWDSGCPEEETNVGEPWLFWRDDRPATEEEIAACNFDRAVIDLGTVPMITVVEEGVVRNVSEVQPLPFGRGFLFTYERMIHGEWVKCEQSSNTRFGAEYTRKDILKACPSDLDAELAMVEEHYSEGEPGFVGGLNKP